MATISITKVDLIIGMVTILTKTVTLIIIETESNMERTSSKKPDILSLLEGTK